MPFGFLKDVAVGMGVGVGSVLGRMGDFRRAPMHYSAPVITLDNVDPNYTNGYQLGQRDAQRARHEVVYMPEFVFTAGTHYIDGYIAGVRSGGFYGARDFSPLGGGRYRIIPIGTDP